MKPTVWSVQSLLLATSDALAARFGAVTVEGEIAGFARAASGHCYFTLKDAEGQAATLRCAMFRRASSMLTVAPRDGMRVQLRGRVSVYEARGELQMVVEALSVAGEGSLYERFVQLRQRLEREGWFADERKRAVPLHVRRVGIVTSLAAAALHDVARVLKRRSPHVSAVVYPAAVQGAEAPDAIAQALALASRRSEVDVILLVRGGGSLEDLWAFNDERVVKAVAASSVPVVVGVGHETDVTLADLVADLRAATPTAAAEMAVAAQATLLGTLADLHAQGAGLVQRRLDNHAARLDRAALLAGRPAHMIHAHHERLRRLALRSTMAHVGQRQSMHSSLDHLRLRCLRAVERRMDGHTHRLGQLQARVQALDPARVLTRGYAWVTDEQGKPVVSAQSVKVHDGVHVVWADGRARASVERVDLNRSLRSKPSGS